MDDLAAIAREGLPGPQRKAKRLLDAKGIAETAERMWLESVKPYLPNEGGFAFEVPLFPRAEHVLDRESVPDHTWQKIWGYTQDLTRARRTYISLLGQAIKDPILGVLPSVRTAHSAIPEEYR
jgi:hypothetical protein